MTWASAEQVTLGSRYTDLFLTDWLFLEVLCQDGPIPQWTQVPPKVSISLLLKSALFKLSKEWFGVFVDQLVQKLFTNWTHF